MMEIEDEKLKGNIHYIKVNGLWFKLGDKSDMFRLDILRYLMSSTPSIIYGNEKFVISF